MAAVAAFDSPILQPFKEHCMDPVDLMKRQMSDTSTSASFDPMTRQTTAMTRQTSEDVQENLLILQKSISSSERVNLTEAQVLSLLGELLEGFSTPEFQEEVQSMKWYSGNPGHMRLTLKVHRRVLPKYRLPGTSDGVLMMLREVTPLLGNWMVGYLIDKIDEKLGLPEGTSRCVCLDLQHLDEEETLADVLPPAPQQKNLTRMHVLSMASDLLDGFSTEDFQQKLQELLRKKKSAREVPGRMELALTVQSKVLPKYGFPGTFAGVTQMLDAISPFMHDWMVQHLLCAIDDKLGMNPHSPAETLTRLTDTSYSQ